MNLFLLIGILLVVLYLLLNFFTKASSKKIAKGIRYIFFSIGILLAIALLLVGRYAFSIPILLFLNISLDDAYNILGCKKGCSKDEILSKYKKIMSKLHPDRNNDTDTTKLAQMVSEAKETILKNDFN